MTQLSDFCLRCACEPRSKECEINCTILSECKIQRFNCKLLRYQYNQRINK